MCSVCCVTALVTVSFLEGIEEAKKQGKKEKTGFVVHLAVCSRFCYGVAMDFRDACFKLPQWEGKK